MPITTNVVGSNPAHGKVYSIQQWSICAKVCQWLATIKILHISFISKDHMLSQKWWQHGHRMHNYFGGT